MPNQAPEKLKLTLFGKILVLLIIIAVGGGVWFGGRWFWHNRPAAKIGVADNVDPLQVITNVRKLIILPANEQPTVVKIENADELKREQPFYQDAKNGDWVVVYLQSKKAIIYDPIQNILVNVGPIALSATTTPANLATTTPTIESKLLIEVLNGSGKKGLAAEVAEKIKTALNWEVFKVGNAIKSDYHGLLVINLAADSGTSSAAKLAGALNGQVVTAIPAGEATTTAQILVIVGQ